MLNAISIDVEDYFQVAALSKWAPYSSWDNFELRVERNTDRILELFSNADTKGTFFILGWIAERCPELILSLIHI